MTKKFKIATLALSACMALGVVGFTACGQAGKSAYDIWLEQGNTGTAQDFLNSLKGAAGKDGVGTNGKSAYEIWKEYHPEENLTETQWLESLKGATGETPEITISDDGYWEINGEKTSQKAQGNDGDMPEITISDDGYWEINGQKTSQKAQGDPGTPGAPGTAGARGNKITKGEGAPASTEGAVEGDMYVDVKEWHVYFFESGAWKDYGSIKGEGGGSGDEGGGSEIKPTPAGTEIDIQANGEQEIDVTLTEGVHIITADLGATTLTTGKLQAQIGDVVSQLELSETRSAAAGSNHHIYFGCVVVLTETETIKILAKNEAVRGSIQFEDYVQPTLSIGSTVEIPVNYQNIAEPIAIKLDNSIKNSTTYKLTINCTSDAVVMNVYLNSDSTQAMFVSSFNYGKEQNATFTTLKDSDNTLHLTVPGLTTNLYAATIKLELAS